MITPRDDSKYSGPRTLAVQRESGPTRERGADAIYDFAPIDCQFITYVSALHAAPEH
jgi:hypothetical protein